MSQIIVSPREQRAFASALAELSAEMRGRERVLAQHLAGLRSTWSDAHYTRFSRAQEEMSLYLLGFHNRAQLYCAYLGRKAAAAEKYLRT